MVDIFIATPWHKKTQIIVWWAKTTKQLSLLGWDQPCGILYIHPPVPPVYNRSGNWTSARYRWFSHGNFHFQGIFNCPRLITRGCIYIYVIYVHMQGYVLSSLMVSRFSQDWKQWNCRCLAWQCPPPGWCGDWTTSIAPPKKYLPLSSSY